MAFLIWSPNQVLRISVLRQPVLATPTRFLRCRLGLFSVSWGLLEGCPGSS